MGRGAGNRRQSSKRIPEFPYLTPQGCMGQGRGSGTPLTYPQTGGGGRKGAPRKGRKLMMRGGVHGVNSSRLMGDSGEREGSKFSGP